MKDTDELVSIYKAPDAVTANIVAADLKSNGIASKVSGENQAAFVGVPVVGVEVLVHADDVDRARKIIRKHEPKGV
jgi:hypothetical protein